MNMAVSPSLLRVTVETSALVPLLEWENIVGGEELPFFLSANDSVGERLGLGCGLVGGGRVGGASSSELDVENRHFESFGFCGSAETRASISVLESYEDESSRTISCILRTVPPVCL